MNPILNLARKTLAVGALAVLVAMPAAQAAEQHWQLTGVTDSGPLAGQSFSAVFSFDDALLSGFGDETIDVTGFNAQVFDMSYSDADLAAAPTVSFLDGMLLGLNAVYEGGSALVPGFAFISGYFDAAEGYFSYELQADGGPLAGFGSYALAPVPEPEQAALLLAGLGLIAGVARRRLLADKRDL